MLNVRGILNDDQRITLIEDAVKYDCKIIAITETHIPDKELEEEISIIDEKDNAVSYILYSANKEEKNFVNSRSRFPNRERSCP